MKNNEDIYKKQEILNIKLAQFFKEHGIKNLTLISLGNSIGSGYSIRRTIKPLLLRNETLEDILKDHEIELERYHFARAQNNNDERMFEWIMTNIKESEIHKLNRSDYSGSNTSMQTHGLNDELIEEYYPLDIKNDIGLRDALSKTGKDLANITIYNGGTGAFLDGITRKGNLIQKLIYGFNRDVISIESSLKAIQSLNREQNSNTQVYLCGAPDFLGINISSILNNKLKKIAKKYANVVYVEPVKAKFMYQELEAEESEEIRQLQEKYKDNLKPDIHYDEDEYIKFNNNIIKSINDNYNIVRSLINLDRNFYHLSSEIEINNPALVNKDEIRKEAIKNYLNYEYDRLDNKTQRKKFLNRAKEYLIERLPFDFYYLGKKELKESIEETDKKNK